MALLDLMLAHGAENGVEISAVTVDHGLRQEAKEEIDLVAGFCESRGIRHDVLNWHWDGKGNLQAAARDARYELIADWSFRQNLDLVALGHTKDDVAETFLMRLARSSGVDGLAKMEQLFERNGASWVRPLLDTGRAELRSYLKRQGIKWADDPSNEDEGFERVRARRVLTTLEPLDIDAETILAVAQNMFSAKSALKMYTFCEATKHAETLSGDVILPAAMGSNQSSIPPEILMRLRRTALQFVSGSKFPPRGEALTDMRTAMTEGGTYTLHGCVITEIKGENQHQDRWRISREYNAVKDLSCASDQLWDGRWQLDGRHAPDLEIRALGDAVKDTEWRESGLPRETLRSSPAIWRGNDLVAAPIAGYGDEWQAKLAGHRDDFASWLLRR